MCRYRPGSHVTVESSLILKLERGPIGKGKREHRGDTPFQHGEHLCIRAVDFFRRTLDGCRIGYAPVRGDRCPGHTGQTSLAALSQAVKTKFITGASGLANAPHDLLRRPPTLGLADSICCRASGRPFPNG